MRRLFILLAIFLPTTLFPQSDKLIVSVEKADIYAEPSARSYRIDTVNRGAVLNLFQKAKVNDSWYYVRFQSRRYGGPAMGFIKDTAVEPFPGEQKTPEPPPLPLPETKPPPEAKEKTVPEKTPPIESPPPLVEKPVSEKRTEPPEPVIHTEELTADTPIPSGSILDPALASDTFRERSWILTKWDAVDTPMPYSRSVQISVPQDILESRIWEVIKPEPQPVPEPTPPPKKEIAPPVEKPPAKPPKAKEEPLAAWTEPPAEPHVKEGLTLAVTEYSDKISLSKGADSFEVRLNYAPYGAYRAFEIPNPNRMVIDFEDVAESAGFFRYRVNDLGIAFIRVAMFQDNIARVVLDFTEEIPAYQIEQIDTGINILFWLAEPVPAPKAETKAEPAPPPKEEAKPEPEVDLVPSTEEALLETATPISIRFSLAEPMYPRRPRLFLWIEGDTVETVISRPSLVNLPAYYPPAQETFWEVVRTEPVKAEPKAKQLDIPPPQQELETVKRKETEKTQPASKDVKVEKPPSQTPYSQPQVKLPARLALGLGYGSSSGGFGGFVQYAIRPNLALHGGAGYYPTSLIYSDTDWVENQVLWSLGLKYYVPVVSQTVRAFLNLQYGGFTVEAVQIIEGIWDYEFIYRNEQKSLYGPQALLGGEFHLGPLRLNAAAGAAYALTDWEWLPQNLYFTFDLGILFYLK